MPRPYAGSVAAVHDDAFAAIGQLSYAGLWGGAGTLTTVAGHPGARVDLQGYTGAPAHQMNLQVQVNGVYGNPSTLATVLVASTVTALLPPSPRSEPQQREIVRVIRSALFASLDDFERARAGAPGVSPCIWLVTGTPSS
ncbi:hypothetical protein [Jatrophihabitans sp.]|uniref:hypothetical protein n=1 Tax=Jatrophihabitans sp. TaxID=1932789 RepID=UPI002F217752